MEDRPTSSATPKLPFGYAKGNRVVLDPEAPHRVLFDGELPVLNIGTFDSASCGCEMWEVVLERAQDSGYSTVLNGRFKGGYITRHYGSRIEGPHAIQLELAQRAYMNEETREYDPVRADELRKTLRHMLDGYLAGARYCLG